MTKRIFVFIVVALAVAGVFVFLKDQDLKVMIKGHELRVEIARTLEQQSKGLSGRESLGENKGMLFVYEEPTTPSFWMKDMRFSIDIIWIGSGKRIVDVTENISPDTFPGTFSPQSPVQYVLEVHAGWAKDKHIAMGDEVHGGF